MPISSASVVTPAESPERSVEAHSSLPRTLLLLQGCPLELLGTAHVLGGGGTSPPACFGFVIDARVGHSLHISDIQRGKAHLIRL